MRKNSNLFLTLEKLFPNFKNMCIITSCFPPSPKNASNIAIGGIYNRYQLLTKELNGKRFFAISQYYGKKSKDQESPNVHRMGVYSPYQFGNKSLFPLMEFFNPKYFLKTLKILMRRKPDFVLVGATRQMSVAPIVAAKLLGITVVIQHDWLCPLLPKKEYICGFTSRIKNCGCCLENFLGSSQNSVFKYLFGFFSSFMLLVKRNLWNQCIIFADSHFLKDFYVNSGINAKQIHIVPSSPTLDQSTDGDPVFMNKLKAQLGNSVVVAYVGRVSKAKGIEVFLNTYQHLTKNTNTPIKFLVAGDGPLSDVVKKTAELNPNIIYLHWLSKAQLKCVYQLTDIVVIPTVVPEAYPTVATEALEFNRKIVGFKMGGLLEIAKDHKQLVSLVDNVTSEALAEEILKSIQTD